MIFDGTEEISRKLEIKLSDLAVNLGELETPYGKVISRRFDRSTHIFGILRGNSIDYSQQDMGSIWPPLQHYRFVVDTIPNNLIGRVTDELRKAGYLKPFSFRT